MKKLSLTVTAAAITLAFGAGAMASQAISNEEYKAGEKKIAAEYKSAKAACDSLKANAKDICIAEAKGSQKVAKAELEASKKPSDKTRYAVSVAKAEAAYAVAREKCDDQAGADKSACEMKAKAAETRDKADAKAQMKTADSSKPVKEKSTTASKHESAGAYVDDSVITTKVKAAVLEEPSLKSAEINVETFKGVVQLTGFVSSRASIDKAVEVSRNVKGVKSVKNDMIVKGKQ